MIGMKIAEAKKLFFDGPRVERESTKKERKWMGKFGAFVRTRAQTSMRRPSARARAELRAAKESGDEFRIARAFRALASKVGEPPLRHTDLLRKNLFFVYEPVRHSVLIGPVKLNKPGQAPEALEHGGSATLRGRTVQIKPRPYMGPAFEAEKPKVPQLIGSAK